MFKKSMSKKEMEARLRGLLSVLMGGTREEFKKAKKEIKRLWNHETEAFQAGAWVVFEFLPKFEQIESTANKEAFISGLSSFYLTLADDHFEILKNFALTVLQYPHGHIREAMRKTAEWLYISLTARANPFVSPKDKKLTKKQEAEQIVGREQYLNYVKEIEALMEKYDDGSEDVEYIDEMKPSVSKSLQQLYGRLADSRPYQRLLEATGRVPHEILVKRKEIEQELVKMLKEIKSDYNLADIKDIIFHEDGTDDLTDIIAMLDTGQGAIELQKVLEIVNDAWNYFPHKIIDGSSPAEQLLEYRQPTSKLFH